MKKMSKSTTTVLKKMFKIAKAPYPKNDSYFKKPDWFLDYSVTKKQEDRFKEWMINYLNKDRQARIDILDMSCKNKRMIKIGVDFFVFNYFWKVHYVKNQYLLKKNV